jgi:hypothetical protein
MTDVIQVQAQRVRVMGWIGASVVSLGLWAGILTVGLQMAHTVA